MESHPCPKSYSHISVLSMHSWGQYWGEMGYFRIKLGSNILGIEQKITWATPGSYTVKNYPCSADGKNCRPTSQFYVDPSENLEAIQRRLRRY